MIQYYSKIDEVNSSFNEKNFMILLTVFIQLVFLKNYRNLN